MIRISAVKGGARANRRYLEHEREPDRKAGETVGYYSQKGGAPSRWAGKGAETLGLTGPVDGDRLEDLLGGHLPDGTDLSDSHKNRRMAEGIVVSAPKAASILSVQDGRWLEWHDQAVLAVAQFVEQKMVYARVGKAGAVSEYTGNMVCAIHRHEDARPVNDVVDPEVHSHLTIINATQRADGKWAGLKVDLGHYAPGPGGRQQVGELQLEADALYMATLAQLARDGGYSVSREGGHFAVDGITREQVDEFSGRRQQILDKLAERGLDGSASAETRDAAWKITRSKKQPNSQEEQRYEWLHRLREAGIDARALQHTATGIEREKETDRAERTVREAFQHVAEREAVFSVHQVRAEALLAALDNSVSVAALDRALAKAVTDGELIAGGSVDRDGTGKTRDLLTTREHLTRELEIIGRVRDGKEQVAPIFQPGEPLAPRSLRGSYDGRFENFESGSEGSGVAEYPPAENHLQLLSECGLDAVAKRESSGMVHADPHDNGHAAIGLRRASGGGGGEKTDVERHPAIARLLADREARQGWTFSEGQREAVRMALTSRDRHIGIVGAAGSGKTTAMEIVVEQYKKAGYTVIGVAPSAAAAKELQSAGCTTMTLASLLMEKEANHGKTLYLLDEAGMVGSSDFQAFLARADRIGARTLSVGDPRQLQAVAAGGPFQQMLEHGMTHARIDQINRQTDPQLRKIAEAFAKGDAAAGLDLAQPYVHEVDTNSKKKDKNGEPKPLPVDEARDRMAQVAAWRYLVLEEEIRRETLLLAASNETRHKVNAHVRNGLIEKGELGTDALQFQTMEKVDLSAIHKKSAGFYETGMIVAIAAADGELKRGERFTVDSIERGEICGYDRHGKKVRIDPAETELNAYRSRDMELRVGETVIFLQNDRERGIRNGDVGRIVARDGKPVAVIGDREVSLRSGEVMDYGYCRTIHKSQGATSRGAIVILEGSQSGANLGYVALSREKEYLQVITNDWQKIKKSMQKFVQKAAAIDAAKRGQVQFKMPMVQAPVHAPTRPIHTPERHQTNAPSAPEATVMQPTKQPENRQSRDFDGPGR
ncbi:relaxase domain-containing protein [Acidithiobacillus sp. CV18-2]|nr:relaxase domain-containing protein [Acidithiobacillus sp. CV18-3]MBU2758348.1 relaxase domain-containing protein [Acidithiobacillus sp. BN09-2]MBU2778227.1 relaxase domain-containing protein [Acidithiobacillus sp. CV18-2]MBU2799100.1 relaxase domain-containing protein [Acidithiobacillus sp. VAN18-4]